LQPSNAKAWQKSLQGLSEHVGIKLIRPPQLPTKWSLLMSEEKTLSSQTQRLMEWIDETFDVVVYPAGYEDCIVGVAEKFGGPPIAVMDLEKMLEKLEQEGMSHEEALEYFEYNILGAYVGEQTPVYMHIPNFKTATEGEKQE
jgi:hypothetical protein